MVKKEVDTTSYVRSMRVHDTNNEAIFAPKIAYLNVGNPKSLELDLRNVLSQII